MRRVLPISVAILLLAVGVTIGWVAANRFSQPEHPLQSKNDAIDAPKNEGEMQPVVNRPGSPYCMVEAPKVFKLDKDSALTTWDFRVHGIKKLTFQVLAIKDGKKVVPRVINYEWINTNWKKEDERTASVAYWLRLEDGKLIPSLSVVEMNGFGISPGTSSPYHLDWSLKGVPFSSRRDLPGPVAMARPLIIAADIKPPPNKDGGYSFTSDGNVATLTKQTEGGGTALAVTMEWTAD
jgi:hypothetical protein